MKTILVTGVGGPAGRSVSALLKERGYSIIGTDMQKLEPEGIEFFQVPPARDPLFFDSISFILSHSKIDLIIPTVSEELPVFAHHGNRIGKVPVLISSAKAVDIANDKYLTAQTLAQANVPVPRFILPSQVKSSSDLSAAIGWPCISKPRVGRGGRDVTLQNESNYHQVKALSDQYILQEFAPGVDFAPNVYMAQDGEDVAIVLQKTELKEGLVGNAKSVVRVDDGPVKRTALAAAHAVGLTGPLDIDIRKRADGIPVVLEINARFGANIRFAPEILDASLGFLSKESTEV